MTFTIQINVGATIEEIQEGILEDLRKHNRGEEYVVHQLSFISWDMFYAMLSPKGLEHMQGFIDNYHAEQLAENASDTHSVSESGELRLEELMTKVTEENKHELIGFGKPVGKEFPNEEPKPAREGWAESGKSIAAAGDDHLGKSEWGNTEDATLNDPSTQTSVVTDAGKSIKLTDLKEFDPADYINNAEDVMLFLKETLAENNPVSLAEALRVILRSDGISKLLGNHELTSKAHDVPTLREMIAQCDLSADRHPDLVSFEQLKSEGKEEI